MTIIKEENIIMPEIKQEPFDYTEIFDCSRFFIPAECYDFEKRIAW